MTQKKISKRLNRKNNHTSSDEYITYRTTLKEIDPYDPLEDCIRQRVFGHQTFCRLYYDFRDSPEKLWLLAGFVEMICDISQATVASGSRPEFGDPLDPDLILTRENVSPPFPVWIGGPFWDFVELKIQFHPLYRALLEEFSRYSEENNPVIDIWRAAHEICWAIVADN